MSPSPTPTATSARACPRRSATALDVTVQAQILDLMIGLQKEMGMAIILITHDLGVIAETCDDVVVMYAGRVAESGPVRDIFERPKHPYTKGLLDSIPRLDHPRKTRLSIIEGMVPGLLELPPGCRFQNRCPYRKDLCAEAPPPMESVSDEHGVACFRWKEI
jgi:peptide/nickel transport system ATP-binding protein